VPIAVSFRSAMNHEEQDNLWELLGKARERKASPFFANKVMHAIRRQEEPKQESRESIGFWMWLRRRWIIPVAAGACAVVAALSLLQNPASPPPSASIANLAKQDPLAEMVTVLSESDDYDTALNVLLANEDNSVWLAADPPSLF
jgi:hypothetical protein